MTEVAGAIRKLLDGAPLSRAAMPELLRAIDVAISREARAAARGGERTRMLYSNAIARLRGRLAEVEASEVARREQAQLESLRRANIQQRARETFATFKTKQDAERAATIAARWAEVDEARPVAAVLLDALEAHAEAMAAWDAAENDAAARAIDFDRIECEHRAEEHAAGPCEPCIEIAIVLHRGRAGGEPPRTPLDVMQDAHEADHRRLRAERPALHWPNPDPTPLAATRDLREIVGARALMAHKLQHPEARGRAHVVFRMRADGKSTNATEATGQPRGSHFCRYCGDELENVPLGAIVSAESARHGERCALQFLAGLRGTTAPGDLGRRRKFIAEVILDEDEPGEVSA